MIVQALTPPGKQETPNPSEAIAFHLESCKEAMEDEGISSLVATETIPAGWDEDRGEAIPAQHTIALIHQGTAAQCHMIRWMLSTLFDIH